MNAQLIVAASLLAAIAVTHSCLGERYIIRPLLRRDDLPTLFGDDSFTRQTVRFGWHLTTIAWFGLAAILVVLSGAFAGVRVGDAALFSIAVTFVVSALTALVFTRARHLSWVVFSLIAALCLWVLG